MTCSNEVPTEAISNTLTKIQHLNEYLLSEEEEDKAIFFEAYADGAFQF